MAGTTAYSLGIDHSVTSQLDLWRSSELLLAASWPHPRFPTQWLSIIRGGQRDLASTRNRGVRPRRGTEGCGRRQV